MPNSTFEPLFLCEFKSKRDIEEQFSIELKDTIEILIAVYDLGCYEGQAFVLFRDTTEPNKLYEVNEYHCSCHGLEHWDPEETTISVLKMRNFYGFRDKDRPHIQKALERVEEYIG